MQLVLFILVGFIVGSMIAVQNVINASLGRYAGIMGAVLVVGISSLVVVFLVVLLFPRTANLRGLPGPDHWYLYLGGVLGFCIVAAPVILIPRIGATATVTAIVAGQLVMALIADQVGLLGNPRILVTLPRIVGVALLAAGVYLVGRT